VVGPGIRSQQSATELHRAHVSRADGTVEVASYRLLIGDSIDQLPQSSRRFRDPKKDIVMNNRPNFSRRDALSLLGLTATALVAQPAFAVSTKPKEDIPLLYRFRIGDFSAVAVSDGFLRVPEPHSFYAPQESTAEFQALLKDWYISPDRVFLPFNILLIDTGKERVLIDAGNGNIPDRVDPGLGRAQQAFNRPDTARRTSQWFS